VAEGGEESAEGGTEVATGATTAGGAGASCAPLPCGSGGELHAAPRARIPTPAAVTVLRNMVRRIVSLPWLNSEHPRAARAHRG